MARFSGRAAAAFGEPKAMKTAATPPLRLDSMPVRALLAGVAVTAALVWATAPTLFGKDGLVDKWTTDSRYSHGYLVPLFSLYLLWSRRDSFRWDGPSWWGVPFIAIGVALCLSGRYLYFFWLNQVALLPLVAGAVLMLGGWRALRWASTAIAFLAFMIPLPYRLQVSLAMPLQNIGTTASVYALQTMGLAPYADGNRIILKGMPLEVAEACSGLGMLVVFFAIATAYALVSTRPWLDRSIAIVSAIPIAVLCNVARITVTGVLYVLVGQQQGERYFHGPAGWLMMLLALALLTLEMRTLDWVFPPRQVRDRSARRAVFVAGLGPTPTRDSSDTDQFKPGMGVVR
jgi:exosortase